MKFIQILREALYDGTQTMSYQEILDFIKNHSPSFKIELGPGEQKWGRPLPDCCYYGDIPYLINPVDNMGWDVIIVSEGDHKVADPYLAGVIKISDNADQIPYPKGNKPGNHKLIFSDKGILTDKQKDVLNNFLKDDPAFQPPEYFNMTEDWEKSTMNGYKLKHVNDGIWGGIAVGPKQKEFFRKKK